jgi:membrane-associated HD superfamily phosphohydrolase
VDLLFLRTPKNMASLLSTYSKEELYKKWKKQKTMLIIQGILLFLMVIFAVFSTVENGISFKTFLPLFFGPMLFVMLFEIKNIKKELATRK